MDRREQITQMLKDRIRKFKEDNAEIWQKTERDRSKPLTQDERETVEEQAEPTMAERIKRELGY